MMLALKNQKFHCRDKYFSWIDQSMQSEVCEEFNNACEVPPLEDGTCNYAAAMPKFMDDEMADNPNAKNRLLHNKLQERIRNKWIQSLGSTVPSMTCTM